MIPINYFKDGIYFIAIVEGQSGEFHHFLLLLAIRLLLVKRSADQGSEESRELLRLTTQQIDHQCRWFYDWLCIANRQYNQLGSDQK